MTVFGCPEASADILRRSAISFNIGKPQILYSVLNKIAQSNVGTDRIAGVDFFLYGRICDTGQRRDHYTGGRSGDPFAAYCADEAPFNSFQWAGNPQNCPLP